MIVDNGDFVRMAIAPDEADSVWVVYANAELTCSVALQRFEPIGGWLPQVVQRACVVKRRELPNEGPLDLNPAPYADARAEGFDIVISVRPDHR